jgi:EAL domain-containing protein (putative c-di-GMP-specific phosphodiesterase class I)
MVSPLEFIPIAEETGLIIPIGKWVLESTCDQLKRWNSIGKNRIQLSANVSARQFQDPDFISELEKIITSRDIDPQALTLEITESLLMQDIEQNIALMTQLKAMGVKLSIDDFGTGYSSLAYLKNLPIDELKIDRSFIMDIPGKEDSCAIVSAIIYLARKLGFRTVAEGIETAEQVEYLRREHCEQYQGFYFSKPVPAAEMTRMLLSKRTAATHSL